MNIEEIIGRLLPVLVFVASISFVVNVAAAVGAIEKITDFFHRASHGSAWRIWWFIMLLAAVSTAFLSLDTTAILVTPLAMALSRRLHINPVPLVLGIIWIANLGSLPIPVSNLTNLLSVSGGMFHSTSDYFQHSWAPAILALAIALLAAALVFATWRKETTIQSASNTANNVAGPNAIQCLWVLAILIPTLASPIPYWFSSTVAALFLGLVFARTPQGRGYLSWSLIPWSSLIFVAGLSILAFLLHSYSTFITNSVSSLLESSIDGPAISAALGALTSNAVNNIPAFLALEPTATTPEHMMALLIGVNAGPIVTPWASLATLLCLDQARRAGVHISWKTIIGSGLILVPFAVGLPAATLLF